MRAASPRTALALCLALLACGTGTAQEEGGANGEAPELDESPHTAASPNRLAGESSPYLLLHADNPVDWYPWDEEALARAREEDKPIFLSVGYSSCYWCHVMERKVFSDPEIAALMNRWFVNVKVDREERPDLDEIYMTATQLMTRSGGWPNSVFLTPELEPFYAGTYFPPEGKHGRPGFPTVLRRIHEAWTERRGDVESDASRVADALREALSARAEPAGTVPDPEAAQAAVRRISESYDEAHGGFGRAPKFPTPGKLLLLWEAGEPGSEEHGMVVETLRRMGRGGIYDHLGGGFHRYSTDALWLVPHFEKMLYDNAHLAELLALAWEETGDPELARLARGTLDFVLRELTHADGGFLSAIDAQTDGEEGVYYVWSEEELRSVLGDEGFTLLAPIYGFDGGPSFEDERYVLHLTEPLTDHAERLGISREELLGRLRPHLDRLLTARQERERPLVDDKVLTDWNGMMVAGMARAGAILEEPRYVEAAAEGASFVLERLGPEPGLAADRAADAPAVGEGRGDDDRSSTGASGETGGEGEARATAPLRHAWRGGEAKIDAFLDDYAFLLRGLVALHEATGEARWLTHASRLADELERRLAAPGGGYYLSEARPELLVQPLTVTGGALPSGNAVAAHTLLALAGETGQERFRERAERSLRAFGPHLERFPAAVPMLAAAVLRFHREAPPAGGGEGTIERAAAQR